MKQTNKIDHTLIIAIFLLMSFMCFFILTFLSFVRGLSYIMIDLFSLNIVPDNMLILKTIILGLFSFMLIKNFDLIIDMFFVIGGDTLQRKFKNITTFKQLKKVKFSWNELFIVMLVILVFLLILTVIFVAEPYINLVVI